MRSTTPRYLPLTDRGSGAYSWLKWEESRRIDNIGLKDSEAKEKAVAAGKLTGELFDKAVQSSGRAYYEKLHARIREAGAAATTLAQRVDERFGLDAPSLKEVIQAIASCDELVGKLLSRLGGHVPGSEVPSPAGNKSSVATNAAQVTDVTPMTSTPMNVGLIVNRKDAVRALREVASFFRHNEPHSPVALLAERAANWAEMPLERWLEAVIKDQTTLGQLRELLDIRDYQSSSN